MIIRIPLIEIEAGLIIGIDYKDKPKTFPAIFRAHFGTTVEICYLLVNEYRVLNAVPKSKPKHLLWGLLFLKQYSNETVLASQCRTTRKTFRKWCWAMIEELSNLEPSLVRLILMSIFIDMVKQNI